AGPEDTVVPCPCVLGHCSQKRRLALADMSIFGHCPAHDDFYLVVCNHCSQVVKPQAFQKHCGECREDLTATGTGDTRGQGGPVSTRMLRG
uniref:Uncharacterized protein n=1 Tax=Nothoprocta perdicaria TaxID=30464 RepID=A0A8C6ZFJ1_NOTPE